MGIRGELFTLRVDSTNDGRTYFFNVKENRKGDRFIAIVESVQRADSEQMRHQVMLYEDDIDDFRDGLIRAIEALRE